MDKKLDTTLTKVSEDTFRKVKECIEYYDQRLALPMLKALFETGVPANGYRVTKAGTPVTYLSLAYTANRHDVTSYLIGLNYKELNDFGWSFTPYLWSDDARQALIDAGHNFAKEIANTSEAFWTKAWHIQADFVEAMGKNGARFDIPVVIDRVSYMPIVQFATSHDQPGVVEAMIATGSSCAARTYDGRTVLHAAVARGNRVHTKKLDMPKSVAHLEGIIRAVVDAGGDVDMVDIRGRSALHDACDFGYCNKARALLEAGADPLLKDNGGKTPEDLARVAKRRDVLQLFAATRARGAILDVASKAMAKVKGDVQ